MAASISFNTSTNGLGRVADNEDNVSGLYFLIAAPTAYGTAKFKRYRNIAAIVADGITEASANYSEVYYQASEFFRFAPGAELFLLFTGINFPDDLILNPVMQGRIKQIGVNVTDLGASITQWQSVATNAEYQKAPLFIVAGYTPTTAILPTQNLATSQAPNVSVLICGDGAGKGSALATALGRSYIPCVGALLGTMAKAKVNESVGWVEKYNLSNGTELEVIKASNGATNIGFGFQDFMRYVTLVKYVGRSGTYFADNHTASAKAGNDFAYMNDVRVMNKVKRELYKVYLPMLNSPLKVDAVTGALETMTINRFENVGDKALNPMQAADEISGFGVYVNPNQNVLATGTLEISVEIVPIGVARNIVLNLSFAAKLTTT